MQRLKNSTFFVLALAPIWWMIVLLIGAMLCLDLSRELGLWTHVLWGKEKKLIEDIILSTVGFALPLACFSAGRRSLGQLHPRCWWGWTRERYYGLSAWVALGGIFIIDLALMMLLGDVSEWLISQLPASWGIPIEDLPEESIRASVVHSPMGYILAFIAFAVTPAVVEEVFFRGYIQRLLYSWTGGRTWLSIISTALIFSAIHLSFVGFAARLSSGIILGWVYQRTGHRLMPVMLIHLLGNTIALVALLLE